MPPVRCAMRECERDATGRRWQRIGDNAPLEPVSRVQLGGHRRGSGRPRRRRAGALVGIEDCLDVPAAVLALIDDRDTNQ